MSRRFGLTGVGGPGQHGGEAAEGRSPQQQRCLFMKAHCLRRALWTLLTVIGISAIAICVGAIGFVADYNSDRLKVRATATELEEIGRCLIQHGKTTGRLPDLDHQRIARLVFSKDDRGMPRSTLKRARYLRGGRLVDSWESPIRFGCSDGGDEPVIRSLGPDRRIETKDDIIWKAR